MRRYFGLLFEHQAMSATNTRATANAAARPTAEEMVKSDIGRYRSERARRSGQAQSWTTARGAGAATTTPFTGRRRAAGSLAHIARGAPLLTPHPLRLPQMAMLVPRQNRKARVQVVPHARVER